MGFIPNTHPTVTLSTPLKEYSAPFLKKHNLNYFQIIRVEQNGSISVVSNQLQYVQHCFSFSTKMNVPFIYSCLKKQVLNPTLYYFLCELNLPALPISIARGFNLCNGLTFVERYATHYYMFTFAAPGTNHGVLDFYINNIECLQHFIQNFKEEKKDLLIKLEKSPIILSTLQVDANLKSMLLNNSYKIPVKFRNQESYVTAQEYRCLEKLKNGIYDKRNRLPFKSFS